MDSCTNAAIFHEHFDFVEFHDPILLGGQYSNLTV